MIIGDPYKFSVFVQSIKEWNLDETYCNGVLFICVNGKLFPKEVVTASLRGEIAYLSKKLENIAINEELFNMPKENAYIEIYNLVHPEDYDVDNDYQFDVSPQVLSDEDCYIYAVGNGSEIRILAAELDYIIEEGRHSFTNLNVTESFITIVELDKIVTKLKLC